MLLRLILLKKIPTQIQIIQPGIQNKIQYLGKILVFISVEEKDDGTRLDCFLTAHFPNESRSKIQKWLQEGAIQKNSVKNDLRNDAPSSKPLPSNLKVRLGDVFEINIPEPKETHIKPQKMLLDIVYEDEDLLVINKAAGMVVHPAPGHFDHTLVNALLSHCGESLSGIGGVIRPGIVHRLDKDTSGLMVVAKNDNTHRGLSDQFQSDLTTDCVDSKRLLKRSYKALVFGTPSAKKLVLDGMIGRHRTNRQKMSLLKSGGKRAITHIHCDKIWRLKNGTITLCLLDCKLETGRTHQIRVHCQSIQCPIVGDSLYGKSTYLHKKGLPDEIKTMKRQALHAYALSFIHPRHKAFLEFQSPLAADMENAINSLDLALETTP